MAFCGSSKPLTARAGAVSRDLDGQPKRLFSFAPHPSGAACAKLAGSADQMGADIPPRRHNQSARSRAFTCPIVMRVVRPEERP